MKRFFSYSTLAILAAALCTAVSINSTLKAQEPLFGEQEVEQGQFIAIASPYGEGKHQLLILEQKSDTQACWSESGSNPTLVDPLLLNFDFTGICGRSTDSNGYSMRMNGQDMGLDYMLRIVKVDGDLLLVGTPRFDDTQPEIIVGRTYGTDPGYVKIYLEPGWEFARRTYQERPLGHIYLSFDRSAPVEEGGQALNEPKIFEESSSF